MLAQAQEALRRGDDAQVIGLLETSPLSAIDGAASFFLGVAYHRQQRLQDALHALETATDRHPLNAQAWLARAAVLLDLKEPVRAVRACLEASAALPADADIWFSLAVAREAAENFSEALDAYTTALAIKPDHVGALQNRTARLISLRRYEDAVASAREFAIRYPYAHVSQFMRGDACLAAGLHDESAAAFLRASSLRPGDARTLLHAGVAFGECERFDQAQQLLDAAWSCDPETVCAYRQSIYRDGRRIPLDARSLFLLRHYDAIEHCEWADRDVFLDRFVRLIHESPPETLSEMALGFRALAMGLPASDQLALARRIASGFAKREVNDCKQGIAACMSGAASTDGRIRLGYISPDFRAHPTGFLAANLFGWHDRERFSVTTYLLDGEAEGDSVRQRIADGSDRVVDLSGLDDSEAARRIREDGVDILIDLVGYGDRARPEILAQRPAKIQMSFLAYVATLGASWVDYFIGDSFVLPAGADASFSEALIRLPAGLFLCSYAKQMLPTPPDRAAERLPANAPVLAAMHSHYKIEPAVFHLWMGLLRRHHDAVLWLLDGVPEAVENLRLAAEASGVHRDRLVFAARTTHDCHLARLQLATIALDTIQCNGGATTADALVAGVPVVTRSGSTCAQRMSGSLLNAAGLNDLVVESSAEYEALVTRLLENPEALGDVREAMLRNRDAMPFYRPKSWVGDFEQALMMAFEKKGSGVPAASIEVQRR